MSYLLLCLFVLTRAALCAVMEDPLSDDFIDSINKAQNSWRAGRNFDINTPVTQIEILSGDVPRTEPQLSKVVNEVLRDLPSSFDARQKWPNCESLNVVPDQASCSAGWAVAAVGAMTDRICIFSNSTIRTSLSANDLISCCSSCGLGCWGGSADAAWNYWLRNGIVSGGAYGVFSGCQAFPFSPCEHHFSKGLYPTCGLLEKTPACTRKCDVNSDKKYEKDLHFGDSVYNIYNNEAAAMAEIYKNGPIEATFDVYTDFWSYKSGVYKHIKGWHIGSQSVKILGWGEENGDHYWLAVNSWNEDWGDKGFFKILRGTNECGIENNMLAGKPKL